MYVGPYLYDMTNMDVIQGGGLPTGLGGVTEGPVGGHRGLAQDGHALVNNTVGGGGGGGRDAQALFLDSAFQRLLNCRR